MEEAVLAKAGLTATVYLPQMAAGEKAVSIYINGRAQEARDLAAALEALPRRARAALRPAALIALEPLDWDGDFSPWPAPGLRPGQVFSGGAAERLRRTLAAKEALEARLPLRAAPPDCGTFGYSLGGLMALYALCRTPVFGLCGALSPSLWYEGFLDFMRLNPPRPGARVYLSLGKREEKVKSARFARVGDGVRAAQAICEEALGQENVRLDWFDGGHGTEVPRRLLTGLTWLLAK